MTKEYWKNIKWFPIFFIYKIIYNGILFLLYYNLFILNWIWLLFAINLNYILLFFCILGLNILSLVVICGIFCFGFWPRFVDIVFFFLRGTIPKFGWGICILFFLPLGFCFLLALWCCYLEYLLYNCDLGNLIRCFVAFIYFTNFKDWAFELYRSHSAIFGNILGGRHCKFSIFLWSNTWG